MNFAIHARVAPWKFWGMTQIVVRWWRLQRDRWTIWHRRKSRAFISRDFVG